MKKFTALVLAIVLFCGCAEIKPPISSASQPEQPPIVSAPEKEPPEKPETEPDFKIPEREYKVLAELPTKEGYAIVYEQQMSDEFNKRFSNDTVFWGLYMQLFDDSGKRIETVDFDRHNSNRIPTPVSRLSAEGNYIYFESRHTLEQGPNTPDYQMDYCFYLALNAEGIDEIKPSQLGDRYRLKSYYILADKEDVSLQYTTEYDQKQLIDRHVFRLVGESYGESRIVLDEVDASIVSGISGIIYGSDIFGNPVEHDELYSVSIALDPQTSQAVIKNQKITLALDFAKGIAAEQRQYTEDMLEERAAVSPDGKSEIWLSGLNPYFEGPTGCDFVLKNKDGELKYLCSGYTLYQVEFVDNDRVLISSMDELVIYDAVTGEKQPNQPEFDFGSRKHPNNPDYPNVVERVAVGIDVDPNGNILIAYRENIDRDDGETEVVLKLLDNGGNHIKTVNTGMTMMPYGKFTANMIEVEADGQSAVLKLNGSEKNTMTVAYMP
ncbi:MAG: hypothetical protein II995_01010 [Oscillospiraceae bacterium]|nr:hypothetical protein [Oscillospiraceae bacterium]